jgi:histidine ammonia-lyase
VNPDLNQGLPAFLATHPGVSSGFMIAHVAAVSLLSECKVLAHPTSIDNVPTSGGQEDHVSMGMTAALKFRQIVENAENVAAIELLAASTALKFREPFHPGRDLVRVLHHVREIAPPLTDDRPMSHDIECVASAIRAGRFDEWAIAGSHTAREGVMQ